MPFLSSRSLLNSFSPPTIIIHALPQRSGSVRYGKNSKNSRATFLSVSLTCALPLSTCAAKNRSGTREIHLTMTFTHLALLLSSRKTGTLAGMPCMTNLAFLTLKGCQRCISVARFPRRSRVSAHEFEARATCPFYLTTNGCQSRLRSGKFSKHTMRAFRGSTRTRAFSSFRTRQTSTYSDGKQVLDS